MRPIVIAVSVLAALAASTPAAAGSASRSFGVNIVLTQPGFGGPGVTATSVPNGNTNTSGICISDSLSQQTGALVRVVCANGQFVNIGPRPGQRFFGTHGGAYGYYFGPSYGAIHRTAHGEGGSGTVTSFRVYSVDEADGVLDLLVSF